MNDSEESNITEPTTSTTDHSKVKGSHNMVAAAIDNLSLKTLKRTQLLSIATVYKKQI